MLKKESIGKNIRDEQGNLHMVATKRLLIERILQLETGKSLDWAEVDEVTGRIITYYVVEKLTWKDTSIILIGGYGGEVVSCYLPGDTVNTKSEEDAENIIRMVDTFFEDARCIAEDDFIYLSVEK